MYLKIKTLIVFSLMALLLNGCVTVQPEQPVIINGAAGYLEQLPLPQGCQITIAIIDLNTPGVIVAQKTFNIARAPVPFKFTLPAKSIDKNIQYGVVAMIKYQDQVIFQTYDRFPVINNDKFTTEVLMKAVMAK
ncbi:YbaY family lipoprotein [Shewanella glacialipiscicola]|uniref:Chaperone for general secretion pathway YbaY n=1 Tax=Shewanella glacialipiscicola TaxID=614069 RepID=A0ABQ6J3L7_9GAMM|nr:YbaY family lipoprotein [Shewanella glacialipiscicola]MCL1085246.1 YbaY family lipoprotein [Shewanella glacialipiscicola]MCU7994664.1 YbaY family lipoprotein [Shewanella glacialipiscicola]MCU8026135.1 YbaY family lipoprotein [Shewanella glacialipiscicola]GIU06028.1 chaperone for general secretion pathway YbaY [Shewanella glacialipiscicola]GMA81456.1 chaperone for general secretion pathway YbaY [Shewanella glacialipiscicola]